MNTQHARARGGAAEPADAGRRAASGSSSPARAIWRAAGSARAGWPSRTRSSPPPTGSCSRRRDRSLRGRRVVVTAGPDLRGHRSGAVRRQPVERTHGFRACGGGARAAARTVDAGGGTDRDRAARRSTTIVRVRSAAEMHARRHARRRTGRRHHHGRRRRRLCAGARGGREDRQEPMRRDADAASARATSSRTSGAPPRDRLGAPVLVGLRRRNRATCSRRRAPNARGRTSISSWRTTSRSPTAASIRRPSRDHHRRRRRADAVPLQSKDARSPPPSSIASSSSCAAAPRRRSRLSRCRRDAISRPIWILRRTRRRRRPPDRIGGGRGRAGRPGRRRAHSPSNRTRRSVPLP